MLLNAKKLESIEEKDLHSLIEDQIGESKSIDYKKDFSLNSDSDKKEFLADVSSFANAAGGYLIYGIREEKGVPVEICGLEVANPDDETLRLENLIRDSLEPRIHAMSMRFVPLLNSKKVLIIRIPKSWTSPHMVKFKGHSKFYSRSSAGKYPLDVTELKSAFLLSETMVERIRNFRADRIGKVIADETPISLNESAKIVLHLIPFGAFDPGKRFDLSPIANKAGWSSRYNFDGFLRYDKSSESPYALNYTQFFYNGCIEEVNAELLRDTTEIPSVYYERKILEELGGFLSIQKKLGIEPPLFLMLSLLGVYKYTMVVHPSLSRYAQPIDRDHLLVPEVILENFEDSLGKIMRPLFDAVWNAAGLPRSMNYDDEGNWVGN